MIVGISQSNGHQWLLLVISGGYQYQTIVGITADKKSFDGAWVVLAMTNDDNNNKRDLTTMTATSAWTEAMINYRFIGNCRNGYSRTASPH